MQEALTNIARHAEAHAVLIRLHTRPTVVTAYVEDDGHGFDVAAVMERDHAPTDAGLLGMRERVMLLGGTFNVHSVAGAGTQLSFVIPWETAS